MQRNVFVLALTVSAAACASAPVQGDETTGKQAAIFQSSETGVLMAERPRPSVSEFPDPPQTVWLAVKKAYADLDIPLNVDSPASHQIGNNNFFRSRQFAGQPMNVLVDCGSGMTGPKAASYRIYISLLTLVNPIDKGGTRVSTTFVPMGQDVSGGSTDRIPCGTTGRLEILLHDHVKAALAK